MWFVQLPTRTIEFFPGDTIERAFAAGLLFTDTSVRSTEGPWTTLGEAAGIEQEERLSLTNLVARPKPATVEPSIEAWRGSGGHDGDERRMRGRASPFSVAFVCLTGLGLLALVGCGVTSELASRTERLTVAHSAAQASLVAASASASAAAPSNPLPVATAAPIKCTPDAPGLTSRQIERLQQKDLALKAEQKAARKSKSPKPASSSTP